MIELTPTGTWIFAAILAFAVYGLSVMIIGIADWITRNFVIRGFYRSR